MPPRWSAPGRLGAARERGTRGPVRGRAAKVLRERCGVGRERTLRAAGWDCLPRGGPARSAERGHRQHRQGAAQRAGNGGVQHSLLHPQAGRAFAREPKDLLRDQQPGEQIGASEPSPSASAAEHQRSPVLQRRRTPVADGLHHRRCRVAGRRRSRQQPTLPPFPGGDETRREPDRRARAHRIYGPNDPSGWDLQSHARGKPQLPVLRGRRHEHRPLVAHRTQRGARHEGADRVGSVGVRAVLLRGNDTSPGHDGHLPLRRFQGGQALRADLPREEPDGNGACLRGDAGHRVFPSPPDSRRLRQSESAGAERHERGHPPRVRVRRLLHRHVSARLLVPRLQRGRGPPAGVRGRPHHHPGHAPALRQRRARGSATGS